MSLRKEKKRSEFEASFGSKDAVFYGDFDAEEIDYVRGERNEGGRDGVKTLATSPKTKSTPVQPALSVATEAVDTPCPMFKKSSKKKKKEDDASKDRLSASYNAERGGTSVSPTPPSPVGSAGRSPEAPSPRTKANRILGTNPKQISPASTDGSTEQENNHEHGPVQVTHPKDIRRKVAKSPVLVQAAAHSSFHDANGEVASLRDQISMLMDEVVHLRGQLQENRGSSTGSRASRISASREKERSRSSVTMQDAACQARIPKAKRKGGSVPEAEEDEKDFSYSGLSKGKDKHAQKSGRRASLSMGGPRELGMSDEDEEEESFGVSNRARRDSKDRRGPLGRHGHVQELGESDEDLEGHGPSKGSRKSGAAHAGRAARKGSGAAAHLGESDDDDFDAQAKAGSRKSGAVVAGRAAGKGSSAAGHLGESDDDDFDAHTKTGNRKSDSAIRNKQAGKGSRAANQLGESDEDERMHIKEGVSQPDKKCKRKNSPSAKAIKEMGLDEEEGISARNARASQDLETGRAPVAPASEVPEGLDGKPRKRSKDKNQDKKPKLIKNTIRALGEGNGAAQQVPLENISAVSLVEMLVSAANNCKNDHSGVEDKMDMVRRAVDPEETVITHETELLDVLKGICESTYIKPNRRGPQFPSTKDLCGVAYTFLSGLLQKSSSLGNRGDEVYAALEEAREEHANEIANLQAKHEQRLLDMERSLLQDTTEDHRAVIAGLEASLAKTKSSLAKAKKSKQEAGGNLEEVNNSLKKEVQQLQAELAATNSNVDSSVAELEAHFETLKARYEQQIGDANKEIDEKNQEMHDLLEMHRKETEAVKSLQDKVLQHGVASDGRAAEMDSIAMEVENLRKTYEAEIEALQQQLQDTEEAFQKEKEEINTVAGANLQELEARIASMEAEKDKAVDERDGIVAELESSVRLNRELEENEEDVPEVEMLRAKVQELLLVHQSETKNVEELEQQLQQQKAASDARIAELEMLGSEVNQLRETYANSNSNEEVAELKKQLEETEEAFAREKELLNGIAEANLQELEARIQDLEQQRQRAVDERMLVLLQLEESGLMDQLDPKGKGKALSETCNYFRDTMSSQGRRPSSSGLRHKLGIGAEAGKDLEDGMGRNARMNSTMAAHEARSASKLGASAVVDQELEGVLARSRIEEGNFNLADLIQERPLSKLMGGQGMQDSVMTDAANIPEPMAMAAMVAGAAMDQWINITHTITNTDMDAFIANIYQLVLKYEHQILDLQNEYASLHEAMKIDEAARVAETIRKMDLERNEALTQMQILEERLKGAMQESDAKTKIIKERDVVINQLLENAAT